MRPTLKVGLVLCFAASVAVANPIEPIRVVSPLDTVERLTGRVEIHSDSRAVTVALHGNDSADGHLFIVETEGIEQPISLRAASAEVFFWRGHLVVIVSRQGKALHFSIPGIDATSGAKPVDMPWVGTKSDIRDLDAWLEERYELTRIDTATGIISRGGPQAFLVDQEAGGGPLDKQDPFYVPPDPGSGNGSCGVSCSITCGDQSTCSVTCASNRCASCTCPPSCTCR
jgi:hypothetical protein